MYSITLTAGNDLLDQSAERQETGNLVGLAGDDTIFSGSADDWVFGNQGNDSIIDGGGHNIIHGGAGNDRLRVFGGIGFVYGNEGSDTIDATSSSGMSIVGGQDSADAADSLLGSESGDFILGNGGNDTIDGGSGGDTIVGGFGADSIRYSSIFTWGNEGNDTIAIGLSFGETAFGGQGDDLISGGGNVQGNEGNDTLWAGSGTYIGGIGNDSIAGIGDHYGNEGNDTMSADDRSTVSGGDGRDVFMPEQTFNVDHGVTARIVDLDWSQDFIDVFWGLRPTFATDLGVRSGTDLSTVARQAVLAAATAAGGSDRVAAQFIFSGHTYVAIDALAGGGAQANVVIDITGVTGTIGVSNFI